MSLKMTKSSLEGPHKAVTEVKEAQTLKGPSGINFSKS
jgi:hypothetical protein